MINTVVSDVIESKPIGRTGLQVISDRGIPDSALTTLLGALFVVTAGPYFGGIQLGSAITVPEVVSPVQFWLVVVLATPVWAVLCSRCFELTRTERTKWMIKLIGIEGLVLVGSFFVAPSQVTLSWSGHLNPGGTSQAFPFELPGTPARQDVEVTVRTNQDYQMSVNICGHANPPCDRFQVAGGAPYVRQLASGKGTVDVFHFKENPQPVDFVLDVKYVARRYARP